MFIYKCDNCGTTFNSRNQRRYNKKYCSYKCSVKGRIGNKLSEKHKEKIRQGNLGKIISLESREKMSKSQLALKKTIPPEVRKKISDRLKIVQKGHILSEETKRKISKTLTGRKLSKERREKISLQNRGKNNPNYGNHKLAGANHPNWRGGSSFEPYPLGWNKTFKEQIRYRDGYKCQVCGRPEVESKRRLDVHHIDYNKMNISLDNLISLCMSCHRKTNARREYWLIYFKGVNV